MISFLTRALPLRASLMMIDEMLHAIFQRPKNSERKEDERRNGILMRWDTMVFYTRMFNYLFWLGLLACVLQFCIRVRRRRLETRTNRESAQVVAAVVSTSSIRNSNNDDEGNEEIAQRLRSEVLNAMFPEQKVGKIWRVKFDLFSPNWLPCLPWFLHSLIKMIHHWMMKNPITSTAAMNLMGNRHAPYA